jgi:hypothetical protein
VRVPVPLAADATPGGAAALLRSTEFAVVAAAIRRWTAERA